MSNPCQAPEAASPHFPSVDASQANLAAQPSASRQLLIQFTGSGSEYFRIWIVNLLLILVTLGLYLPWAKVRRLRYFYSNTLIDSEPLHFHGEPLQMFKGIMIVTVSSFLFSLLDYFWYVSNLIFILVVFVLVPILFLLTMRYRLSNTSWRGLCFAFDGTIKDAYRAFAPLIPSFFLVFAFALIDQFTTYSVNPSDISDQELKVYAWLVLGIFIVANIVILPWCFYRLKSYQHRNYRFSSEIPVFTAKAGDYYFILLECVGLFLIITFTILMLCAPFFMPKLLMGAPSDWFSKLVLVIILFGGLIGSLFIVLSLFVLLPISIVGSIQNLVWGATRSEHLQFSSMLRLKQAMALSTKNWLLTLLTLGLYRPYAVIAMTRLRLEAVQIECSVDPSQWTAGSSTTQSNAVGVASGDFWGIDFGL